MTTAAASRRAFIRTAGIALSAPLAAAGASPARATTGDPLGARLTLLEETNALRALSQAFARALNAGDREALEDLFLDPAAPRLEPEIHALVPDVLAEGETVELAGDGLTAIVRMPCSVRIDAVIEPDCPLVAMARAQGGGVVSRWETGVLEHVCEKRTGGWRISRSSFAGLGSLDRETAAAQEASIRHAPSAPSTSHGLKRALYSSDRHPST